MLVDDIKRRKTALGLSNKKMAELSGVPLGTVQKIFSGETKHPRYDTLIALEDVLDRTLQVGFREKAEAYYTGKVQGDYRQEDYFALPDEEGQRYELIDGVIYNMSSPSWVHQVTVGFIFAELISHRKKGKLPCLPITSPIDVYLDKDDKTIVQPDLVVVCDKSQLSEKGTVEGPPSLVVEVLSPSTRRKDQSIKQKKYMEAGVKEYWIVDTQKESVIVYNYAQEEESADIINVYSFNDKIPVAIWGGKLKIDFSELKKEIREIE